MTYTNQVILDVGKHPRPFIERQMMIRRERTPDMEELAKNEWNYVFVYGTLKEGFSNHTIIPSDAKFLGRGHTKDECFKMHATSGYPVVEKIENDGGNVIYGEVYAVKASAFIRLDGLESNGHMYLREKVRIKMLDQKHKHEDKTYVPFISCWMYIGMNDHWNDFKNLRTIDPTLAKDTHKMGCHYERRA